MVVALYPTYFQVGSHVKRELQEHEGHADVAGCHQDALNDVVRVIVEHFQPRRIVRFGSRARGDHRLDSDLDLLIEMEPELEIQGRERVQKVASDMTVYGRPAW